MKQQESTNTKMIAAALGAGLAMAAAAGELTVSPEGLSPQAAIEKIRAAKASGDKSAWTVRVKPGLYTLKAALAFTPADSGTPDAPVTWVGEMDAVFAGGGYLEGWEDAGNGVWEAPAPKSADGKPIFFESLYVNGRRADRARFPKKGGLSIGASKETKTEEGGEAFYVVDVPVKGPEIAALEGLSAEELAAAQWRVFVAWSYAAYPIESYDAAARKVVVKGRNKIVDWKQWNNSPANYFYIENVRGAFTEPGEWFYDVKESKVKYRPLPGEKLSELKALAPTSRLVSIVRFNGDVEKGKFVSDICFRGISFTASRTDGDVCANGAVRQYQYQAARMAGATISGIGAHRVRFEKCRVFNTENYGFRFEDGCVSNMIVSCEIYDAGAGGIWFGNEQSNLLQLKNEKYRGLKEPWNHPFPTQPLKNTNFTATAFNVVDDCEIRHCGRVNAEGCGIVLTHASDSKITHNDISDLYYTGISVGWTWGYYGSFAQRNEISFNRITNIGQHKMADMGGVYTLGASHGTVVSNNVIMNVDSSSYGGWGLYNDEGSEGILWENNLVVNTTADSYHLHFGRNNTLRNNILVNGGTSKLCVSREEKHHQVTFENNIVYWQDGPIFVRPSAWNKIRDGVAKVAWKNNFFWCADSVTELNGPVSGFVADPKFVDPAKNDWRLKPDSPVFRCGFKAWEHSLSGRRKR